MSLETIVSMYGWNDYYDMVTHRIYKLSKAIYSHDGTFSVPVIEDGRLIGYASMKGEKCIKK